MSTRSPDFGGHIRAFRDRKVLSLSECAALLGISASYLSALEHGTRRGTASLQARAREVFGADWDRILLEGRSA
ncbi:MAG TPA: helix-turn-helix domain-containing protein [Holophagaceae bacterium]|nr:helix-turn-helix domain-containing protein [Holophagaceae bacterium]